MTYIMNLYGKGCERTIGTIDQKTWQYIQDEFSGNANDYLEALDVANLDEWVKS